MGLKPFDRNFIWYSFEIIWRISFYIQKKKIIWLFNAKAIFIEEQKWGVHNFLKGISPKVNVIAQLEFKLAYYVVITFLKIIDSMQFLSLIC